MNRKKESRKSMKTHSKIINSQNFSEWAEQFNDIIAGDDGTGNVSDEDTGSVITNEFSIHL